jgi:nicotinate-nucleotide pyrophosphorylase (carboxylating)
LVNLDLNRTLLKEALKSFLVEDVGYGDITTDTLTDPEQGGEGRVICKENAVIAGIEESLTLLELAGCRGTAKSQDGNRVKAGATILSAQGSARGLLGVERTMLNLLSHMSGVATATADLVSIVASEGDGKTRVAATRKTLPGLRYFEKKAVAIGGGDTHRLRLDDAVLIKDNHLALAGTIEKSVRMAKSRVSFTKKVEVEATTPAQAVKAAEAAADIVLLDNMTPKQLEESLRLLKSKGLRERVLVEASGGITRENIRSYAKTGVDVVSVGMITNSAKAIDMSMEIHASKKRS